jgi:RNA-directed DNA polymerase
LQGFFDEVAHYKLLQLIYNKVKCSTTLWLIRKWLRSPILINGTLHKRRKGIPQGSPLSPLLSNIILDVLDKELESRGLKFVCYADDFSIYTRSKSEAREIRDSIYKFLEEKLELPVNRAKIGIRRPSNFELLGHGFVPTYKKGEKGKYQLVVKKSSWKNLKRKLKDLTKKTLPYNFNYRLYKLREVWQGWVSN